MVIKIPVKVSARVRIPEILPVNITKVYLFTGGIKSSCDGSFFPFLTVEKTKKSSEIHHHRIFINKK
jgi:hypothetical protein